MPRFDLANCTFPQVAARVVEYIEPFEQMWPYYWLKAAAVRDGETWHLCYFCLVGRYTDAQPVIDGKPVKPLNDNSDALVAVRQQMDADQAMELLRAIATKGRITFGQDVVAQVPEVVLGNTGYHWQEPVGFISSDVKDVAEPAQWVYLYATSNSQQWLTDLNVESRIRNAIQPDLERRGMRDISQYLAVRFAQGEMSANQLMLNQFNYAIELPLALLVERKKRDVAASRVEVSVQCRKPISVSNLEVTEGAHWSSDAHPVQVDVEVESEVGWSFANFAVPFDCGGLALKSPELDNWLSYPVSTPSAEQQALDAVYAMYTKSTQEAPAAGEKRWRDDLVGLEESKRGARFEVALANALARLGIPVLFGGQIEREGQVGGPATPGIDLVALDLASRRAVAISLKSSQRLPVADEIQSLLDAVGGLRSALNGWTTFGVLACLAPANLLGTLRQHTDVRIWSREDVEFISRADSAAAIGHLLWLPPWVPREESWKYLSGHHGLLNQLHFRPS